MRYHRNPNIAVQKPKSQLWKIYDEKRQAADASDLSENEISDFDSVLSRSTQRSHWETVTREPSSTSLSEARLESRSAWSPRPQQQEDHSFVPVAKPKQSSRITLSNRFGRQLCTICLCTTIVLALLVLGLLAALAIALPLGLILGQTTARISSTESTSDVSLSSITSTPTTTSTSTSSSTTSTSTTSPHTAWIPSNYNQTCTASCSNVTTVTPSTLIASWPFEQNANDQSGNGYNGQTLNTPIYTTGYIGQAIQLQNTLAQIVVAPHFDLFNRSFTVEAWIYLYAISSTSDLALFGQCEAGSKGKCLHYIIRNNRMYLAFHTDDLYGTTNFTANTWYHVAFVYDYSSNRKSVYLNGLLDGTTTTGNAYQGQIGNVTIGSTGVNTVNSYYNGLIDQLTVTNRLKSACEVLNDATLLVRLSFDLTFDDWGPNAMSATYNSQPNNGLAWVAGRVNSALKFNSSGAYVESCSYYALGQSRSFSIAMWVNPSYPGGTLFHLSTSSGGAGAWCLPMIGFSSNGSITIQTFDLSVRFVSGPILPISSWTHIVFTWSATNGLNLYINGGLYASTAVSIFYSSGSKMCFLLGTSGFGTNCQTAQIAMGSFSGVIDEVYVYSRELNATDICSLAHS